MNMRIGGLASGMDIDSMVTQLMQAERMPLDKLFQKRQTLEWQRDAYREVNLSLSKFRDSYSKLRLQSTFIAYSITASNSTAVSGKALTSAVPGTYELKIDQLARAASVKSAAAIQSNNSKSNFTGTGNIQRYASGALTIDAANISSGDRLTINGKTVEFYDSGASEPESAGSDPSVTYVDLYDAETSARKTNTKLVADLAAIDYGAEITVATSSDKLTLKATQAGSSGNHIVSSFTGDSGITGFGNLAGGSDTSTLKLTDIPAAGSALKIAGTVIDFYDSSKGGSPTDANSINIYGKTKEQIADEIRGLSIPNVTLGGSGDEIEVTALADNLTTSYSSNAKSGDFILESGQSKQFTIRTANGTATIRVTSGDTYASLAKKIANATNENGESLGLRANFDDTTSRFFISSKEMGSGQIIEFGGTDADFVKSTILGDPDADLIYTGQNAKFTFDGIVVDDQASNEVTINGISLTLQAVSSEPITVTVKSDTEGLFNTIKDFVEKYNELVEELQGKINEPKYRNYPPLTDEQRKAISDKEAEMWDEKAQSGMLRNDPILRGTLDSLRRAIYDPIAGINVNELNQISKLGITTGDYRNGGKLEINEEKLRAALESRPDEVMNLFTKVGEEKGNTAQMGIGERIYTTLNNVITELRDKAGSPGYTSGDQSTLGKTIYNLNDEIADWEDRLVRIESRYWSQFTAMERALNQMNQQSLWMQQNMFGTSR